LKPHPKQAKLQQQVRSPTKGAKVATIKKKPSQSKEVNKAMVKEEDLKQLKRIVIRREIREQEVTSKIRATKIFNMVRRKPISKANLRQVRWLLENLSQ
jgi:hypothetical protein